MIDHVSVLVGDLARSKEFYVAALGPLGYSAILEFPSSIGLGAAGKPDLWLTLDTRGHIHPVHVAVRAGSRADVDAFHRSATAAGGKDNGPPGVRPHYHPHYYGAFVLDPDGHNLEAVCHDPAG
ncbi:MAG TPA: VOC family protein [Gemmatimonadota bacterium]|jgi:catechol 2,3-dioxygenase-like lactoylglutathione lyase family enzyme